jgi:hypothetical protein
LMNLRLLGKPTAHQPHHRFVTQPRTQIHTHICLTLPYIPSAFCLLVNGTRCTHQTQMESCCIQLPQQILGMLNQWPHDSHVQKEGSRKDIARQKDKSTVDVATSSYHRHRGQSINSHRRQSTNRIEYYIFSSLPSSSFFGWLLFIDLFLNLY